MGRYLDAVVGLAQGGTPSFADVSFPVQADASQRTDLLQRDPDTSVFSFSGDAQRELGQIPPLAQVQVRAHLDAAGDCLANKDYPGCTSHMLMAKAVARRYDAHCLRQELDNRVQEVADHANGTHEAAYADRSTGGEGTQDSPAREELRQGPNTMLSQANSAAGAVGLAVSRDYERVERGREQHVRGHELVEHFVSPRGHYGQIKNGRPAIAYGDSLEEVEPHWADTMRRSWHPANELGQRLPRSLPEPHNIRAHVEERHKGLVSDKIIGTFGAVRAVEAAHARAHAEGSADHTHHYTPLSQISDLDKVLSLAWSDVAREAALAERRMHERGRTPGLASHVGMPGQHLAETAMRHLSANHKATDWNVIRQNVNAAHAAIRAHPEMSRSRDIAAHVSAIHAAIGAKDKLAFKRHHDALEKRVGPYRNIAAIAASGGSDLDKVLALSAQGG